MTIKEFLTVFLLGGSAYGLLEIAWRGRTHWTMVLTGGVCAVSIYLVATRSGLGPWGQYALCAVLITAWEYLAGAVVNVALGWAVWDYSREPFNLYGQVCARYALYWFLLSIPACALARLLQGLL